MEVFNYLPESCKNLYDKYESTLNGQLHIGKYWFFLVVILLLVLINQETNREIEDEVNNNEDITHNIDNIIEQVRYNHIADVNWRRCLIVGLVTAFLICYFLLYPLTIPPGFVYFFIVLIIFGSTYFASAWVSSHWWKMNDYKIEEALLKFRSNKE